MPLLSESIQILEDLPAGDGIATDKIAALALAKTALALEELLDVLCSVQEALEIIGKPIETDHNDNSFVRVCNIGD